eukprot:maker-scaffold_29-snap-gene-1.2-mRNA-1 protein AED:0.25 eAED:0.25 QI:60/1/1/1/1/1/2/114/137
MNDADGEIKNEKDKLLLLTDSEQLQILIPDVNIKAELNSQVTKKGDMEERMVSIVKQRTYDYFRKIKTIDNDAELVKALEIFKSFQDDEQNPKLSKFEIMQLLNLKPKSEAECTLIIKDMKMRLSAKEIQNIFDLFR